MRPGEFHAEVIYREVRLRDGRRGRVIKAYGRQVKHDDTRRVKVLLESGFVAYAPWSECTLLAERPAP